METKTPNIFRKAHAEWLLEYRKHVRLEYRKRIKNGPPITLDEWKEFSGNSYEQYHLSFLLDDEALVYHIGNYLKNCFRDKTIPPVTYDDAVINHLTPMLLKRFKKQIENNKN